MGQVRVLRPETYKLTDPDYPRDLYMLEQPASLCESALLARLMLFSSLKARSAANSSDEVTKLMPEVVAELGEETGLYASLENEENRQHALCSVLSAGWRIPGRYDWFVEVQPEDMRLAAEGWAGW